jgi:hypothetical protein
MMPVSKERKRKCLLLGVLLMAVASGCEEGGTSSSVGKDELKREIVTLAAPQNTRINVVIFLIDALRADRLGVYGYDKPTSPEIDDLASEAVLFTQAYAAAPWADHRDVSRCAGQRDTGAARQLR